MTPYTDPTGHVWQLDHDFLAAGEWWAWDGRTTEDGDPELHTLSAPIRYAGLLKLAQNCGLFQTPLTDSWHAHLADPQDHVFGALAPRNRKSSTPLETTS